jgi:hypothetical protein
LFGHHRRNTFSQKYFNVEVINIAETVCKFNSLLALKSSAPEAVDVTAFTFTSTAGVRLRGKISCFEETFVVLVVGSAVTRHMTRGVVCDWDSKSRNEKK